MSSLQKTLKRIAKIVRTYEEKSDRLDVPAEMDELDREFQSVKTQLNAYRKYIATLQTQLKAIDSNINITANYKLYYRPRMIESIHELQELVERLDFEANKINRM